MNAAVELRHVRYFIAVAEELSFTRAAEKLHIAQPPLSRQIRQLEEEVGVELFIRNRRRVLLTSNGRAFLLEARKLIAQAERAMKSLRPASHGESGTVRVGIAAGLGEAVAACLKAHLERFPAIDVEFRDILSSLQNEALRGRTIDMGFLRPPIDTQHLVSKRLFDERILVMISKDNPLAKRRSLCVKHLAHETLLLHERHVSIGVYNKVLDLYHKAGVRPNILQTPTGPYEQAGTMLVAEGKGVFLVCGSMVQRSFEHEVITIPLDEPDAIFPVHIAWRKDEHSPTVLHMLDAVCNFYNTVLVTS
jgi:DNA-binding transcriptional LysR family regulator